MRYTSTRNPSLSYSFEEALTSGYAPDGGLFVPTELPKLDSTTLKEWSTLSFPQLAMKIIRMFISHDEISNVELESVCHESFVKGFDESVGSTVPVKKVGNSFIAELFHGPTFCFKDLGMRAVVNLLAHFAYKRKKCLTLVVSTTGDTGPAAVQAVNDIGSPFMTLLVHYPKGQISAFQRKQLTTVDSPHVKVATFEGGGDDMDLPIKNMLASSGIKGDDKFIACGVNSYNIGRPLVQMCHFVWTYLRVAEKSGIEAGDPSSPIDIILPTGAMGNIAGGYMVKKMGVPIRKLCACVNINDISHRAIEKGEFHKSAKMEKTLSEAINIQVPYNFERLLFYLTDGDHSLLKEWYSSMETTGKIDIGTFWLEKLQIDFNSARITDEEMCDAIRNVQAKFAYFIDPHTAVAVAGTEKMGYNLFGTDDSNGDFPYAILATASPCKFEESMTIALGENGWTTYAASEFPDRARDILTRKEITPTLYNWPEEVTSLETVQNLWEANARNLIMENFLTEDTVTMQHGLLRSKK